MEFKIRITNVVGYVLTGAVIVISAIVANLIAADKSTEDTYEIMYTISIAYAIDIVLLQGLVAIFQVVAIKQLGTAPQEIESKFRRFCRYLINKDITNALHC
jgi:hypothetical protein